MVPVPLLLDALYAVTIRLIPRNDLAGYLI